MSLSILSALMPLFWHLGFLASIPSTAVLSYETSGISELPNRVSMTRFGAYDVVIGTSSDVLIRLTSDGMWERNVVSTPDSTVTSYRRAQPYIGISAMASYCVANPWRLIAISGPGRYVVATLQGNREFVFSGLLLKSIVRGSDVTEILYYGYRNEVPNEFSIRKHVHNSSD